MSERRAHALAVTASPAGRRRPHPADGLTPPRSPRSYGRYVGRVGALAVALGIGLASATGQGLGVAHADSNDPGADTGAVSNRDTTPNPETTTDPDADTGAVSNPDTGAVSFDKGDDVRVVREEGDAADVGIIIRSANAGS